MTDSEFFEIRVKAFVQYCWNRKFYFFLLFLILATLTLVGQAVLHVQKYRTVIQFAKVDYDLWSSNLYTLKTANIFLKEYVYEKVGGEGGLLPPQTFTEDLLPEEIATPDDFVEALQQKLPRARTLNGVAEIQTVAKDPNFVDKVFYPLVDISRRMVIDEARVRAIRVNGILDEVSRGNLTQKESETIQENRLNFKISTTVREADVASSIDTREVTKNEPVEVSYLDRLRWAFTIAALGSILVFLGAFMLRQYRASRHVAATPTTE